MTLLAPAFLWGAIPVATGIVALHFIVTRQPRASVLPTARFVPDSPATAIVRDARPADLLLMLLRVLVVLAAGAALAKPVFKANRQPVGRIFLVDVSRSTSDMREAADSVRALYRSGDAVVAFDSAVRTPGIKTPDSLATARKSNATGNLSAALIAAIRQGSALRDKVDSMELVVVSPLLADERDAATDSIRKLWHGRARLVHVVAATTDSSLSAEKGDIKLESDANDPLAVGVSLATKNNLRGNARILRTGNVSADDSTWMTTANHVVAFWPMAERPRLAVARMPADRSGGIVGGDIRLVAAFDRHWTYPADSLRGVRVIARWADGEAAVVEKANGAGCFRSVSVPVPVIGDLVIRPEFERLVGAVTAPCGGGGVTEPVSAATIASLQGTGALASRDRFAEREDVSSPFAPWLLALALFAALGELMARSRRES